MDGMGQTNNLQTQAVTNRQTANPQNIGEAGLQLPATQGSGLQRSATAGNIVLLSNASGALRVETLIPSTTLTTAQVTTPAPVKTTAFSPHWLVYGGIGLLVGIFMLSLVYGLQRGSAKA